MTDFLNTKFALRRLLINPALKQTTKSIQKDLLTLELEPEIRNQINLLAEQLVLNPDSVLIDKYDDETERKKDWVALRKLNTLDADNEIMPIDARQRSGHKILDHHMPHFYDVKNYKGVSVRGLFTKEVLAKALMTNIQMHTTPYKSEIRRMIMMTSGMGSVTKYRAITAKALIQHFKAKRVLDPCAGWGGRMLGCLSAGADTYYYGCEPDPNTARGLFNILDDNAIPVADRMRATIVELPAEIATGIFINTIPVPVFDMVLTSPPYYNLELYTAGEQSTTNFPSWEEWCDKWLKKVILNCLASLKQDGVSCWSVKNFKSDKKYPLADVTKKIHEEAGWHLVNTVKMTGSARPGGNRIDDDGRETRKSEEETFCFKRNNLLR